jgi:uncharacterized protein
MSMENESRLLVNCPHCSKAVPWISSEKFRPFCSERCKLLDLGAWADESHRIPGETQPPTDTSAD